MKTKKYILICLLGIFSFASLVGINTVAYATTDPCIEHPEQCDPCYTDPDSCDDEDDCHSDNSCSCAEDPSQSWCDDDHDCHDDNSCSCEEDPNQSWCPHDCNYYNNCSCAENPNQQKCKDPCKENPNLPQCKNKCPNGTQTLNYCTDKPGEQAACQAIVQQENAKQSGACLQCQGQVCKVEPPLC